MWISCTKLRDCWQKILCALQCYTFSMNAEAAKRQFLEYIEIERGRAVKTIENLSPSLD